MKRIERDGYLEVVLSEIEMHRAQGDALGIELFTQRNERRKYIRDLVLTWSGVFLYGFVFWYGVLRAIGAL